MEDTDVALPRLTVQKLVKDAIGPERRVAGDFIDNVLLCCTEFVNLVVSQATQVSDAERKTTISPEHIVQALEQLGLESYLPAVNACWEQFRADSKAAPPRVGGRKNNADKQGMSEEQQAALQEEMFNAAREEAGAL